MIKTIAILPRSELSGLGRVLIVDLLKKGQRINAVKAVRAATNCLLEPAKEYIDDILQPQLDHRTRPCNFVELMPRVRSEREDA